MAAHGLLVIILFSLRWTDVSGAAPVWVTPPPDNSGRYPLLESAVAAHTIVTLSATDADVGDTLTYSLVTTSTDFEEVAGQLRVKSGASLNYETRTSYVLTVSVSDGTTSVSVVLTVDITNVNDETPTITSSASFTATVAEGQNPGASLNFGLTFHDPDLADATLGEKLTYSLEGTDSPVFNIDSQTGAITTAQRLDRETTAVYMQLIVKVTDAATPTAHTATASLTVSVTDINDVTPHCSPAVYTATVAESTAQGTSLATLTCYDEDAGVNAAMTYSIASGDPGTVFQLSANQLQTGATATDYESAQSYKLTIHVADTPASGTARTGTATVVVSVTGVNEHTPQWATWTPTFTASITIAEDSAVGTSILTISATDADSGIDGTITYSLDSVMDSTSASAWDVFRMDPVSGQLSTLRTLDRDNGITSYTVTVKAEDGGTTPNSIPRTVTVNLGDINDNNPVLTASSYYVTLSESVAVTAASVAQCAATDKDLSSTFTYSVGASIVGNPAAMFEFSTTTSGLFQLASDMTLDAGNDPYSVIRVLVTDGGTNPGQRTGTATITLSISPSNDDTPAFGATVPATSPIALPESTGTGTSVATVTATDTDYGADGTVTFSITGGNTGNAFTIVSSGSGAAEIRTLTALDYEGTNSYALVVTARDGGSPAKSASTTVSLTVSNINDNSPTCSNYYIAVTLAESAGPGNPVASLSCNDADGDALTYSVTSGNGDGKFSLVAATGAITLAASVDYDSATQSYTLQISVSDGTNSQTVTVKVTVTAVNEHTPAFASTPTVTVSESEAAGYLVITYIATDADYSPHGITQYAITSVTQSGSSKFTIDHSSGAIKLLAPLDYDTLPTGTKYYLLIVEATDGGGLKGTGTVTVSVSDVNDNAPTCTQSSWSQTVLENGVASLPSTVINSLGCTDVEGTTLNYALTQSPGSHFSISAGRIQQDSAVDYETATSHVLTVVVSDSGTPPLSTTVVVNIIIQNVNEGGPTFGGPYDVTIGENVAIGTSVADVSATDPDGPTHSFGNPQHSIISGDASGQFNIDSKTGRVTTRAALDAETKSSYLLVVKAVELGGANSATVTLTVTVSDVNDNTPSCSPAVFAEIVNEPGAAGDAVLTLTCSDGDVTAATLTYSISSGHATKFRMTSNVLELNAPLDYDAGPTKYDLTITVFDGTNSANVVGSVTVGPVNESPPVFTQTTYTVTKSEALAVGDTVITVTATDGDSSSTAHGVIRYGFTTSHSQFTINSATGVILLSSSLNREAAATHTLLVTASDSATTVTATVSVTVGDENDNSPVFSAATYIASVSETSTAPAAVVTVTATDADDPGTSGNGAVTFSSVIGGANSNHFTIDTATGAIKTTLQLDASVVSSYTLTVTAVDRAGGTGSRSSTAVVIVTVITQNQYDPVFTMTTYTFTTNENTPIGTQLVQVVANDADSGSDGTVTYSMATHSKFSLSSDGWISVKSALDFDTTPNTYSFEVVATDGGATPRSATATVSITVGDVNDNTAVCTPTVLTSQKREDAPGTVATLSCTDADSGANAALTYSIVSVDGVPGAGAFSVDGSGVVSVSSLDYETAASHAVIIKVVDGGTTPRSTSVQLTVTVTDVNENDPTFSGTPFATNIAENKALGSTILIVAASGNDGSDTVTYSLDDTTYLEVDFNSGIITLKAQFDYESATTYSVNVCATDSNTIYARRSACRPVAITVTDVNDNDPVFSPAVYSASVNENEANGVTVTTVTATDDDTLAAGGTVTYSIASGNTNSVFRVDATAGHVIVNDNSFLDYELTTTFALTVSASDGGGRTSGAVVTITVNHLNEGTPTFTPASSTLPSGLAEDTTVGTSIITITATDSDNGPDGTLSYSISSGASGKFSIHPNTGEITLVAALDRETTQTYTLQILAKDGGTTNPSRKTGTYTLTININDVNDVTPSCSLTYYSASISENSAAGASVKDLSCSDGDLDPAGLNNVVTYSMTAGDAGLFTVGATTGSVTVATSATFDRETTPSYTMTLEVVDKATYGKLTATVTLHVDILDENDNTPTFGSNPYTGTAAENAAVGFKVVTVAASDSDIGSNAALTYSLTTDDPSDPGKFRVDASIGDVTVAGALDFESFPTYTLVVTATDKGTPPLIGTTTLSITITDVNDNPPVCASSVYTASLAEDANPATATVVTVSCPDADTPAVTYSLTDTHFAVDSSTGVVTLTSALDYETAQSHVLSITASDGTRTDTTIVQVTVTDVNEFDPTFAPTTPYTTTVAENKPIGFTVKDVDATDADLSDTALTFSITGGNIDGKFTIDSVTGVMQLQGTLDRETTASYSLTLKVADPRARTATTSIDITVSDVNDNNPACTPSNYVATVAEDAANGASVVTLTCSDVDSSTPTMAFTLLAAGNTGTAFAIDASTGKITVNAVLDYETLTEYSLQVEVSDQGTPTARTTTVPVIVSLTPVNEHDPAFLVGVYSATDVPESVSIGTSVLRVAATDADRGKLHGTVRYSIAAGDPQGKFAIDTNTGFITVVKPLDRETTASYSLTVRASDDVAGSASVRTADVTVPITITDDNDNYPVFNPAFYFTTILETASTGGTVKTVTVTDDDIGTNAAVTISIISGNTGLAFRVSGMDIILNAALDYETTSSYVLVLEATDGGTPALTAQAKLTINVDPVNEDAPILTDTNFSDTISETTPIGTLIYTAVASDSDQGGNNDGTVTYAIISGDTTPPSFIVDPNSGEVRVFSQLDFDTPPQTYTLVLRASDGGGLMDTVTLSLTLSDENDHYPQFTHNTYTTTLDENVATSTSVITVTANDNDSGVNGQVTYSITGGNGQTTFSIVPTTGMITTAAGIDYESVPIWFVVVKAVDGGTPALSSTALVRITVVDLNDNPPVVVPDDYTVTVSESVATGTSVAAVAATDADSSAGNNNVILFTLTNADFQVDANSGVITTVNALDRETTASYVLLVTATDQGTNPNKNSVTATVTVILIDVNDNNPVITSTHDITVDEDQPVGSIQLQVKATDADAGDNARLTYTITAGNTNNDWRIIASNGMIQIANPLDRETTASYLLEVTVSDNGPTPRSTTSTATITIGDVNDNNPVFTGTPYSFSVAENSVIGVSVGKLVASDADTGINANLVFSALSYWKGDNSHFSLNAATGIWKTAVTTLDRETQYTYLIWCRVTDHGTPQRHADTNVTITITDINDNPPVFSGAPYTASVAENSAVGKSVAKVTATDADIGANGAVTFTIDTSTAAGSRANTYLQINPTSGTINVKANIDYETDTSFTFKVIATDGGTPTFTATADVTISVTDVNDNRPAFAQTFFNTEIAYAGQCSNSVATPVCNDADSGANGQVACYMVESTYDYLFAVNASSCAMTTQTLAAANSKYVVDLQCRDSGSPMLTAATPATIRVDTFIPDNTVVKLELSISRADFVAQQATFLSNLQALIRVKKPTSRLQLWCIQERSGTATSPPSGRRRLLQSAQPVDVMVFAVADDTTDDPANTGLQKTFLTSDELMAYYAADASGTPSSSVSGGSWDYYGIQRVTQYRQENTPWIQTPEGIAVVTAACVLAAALLALLIIVIVVCYRKRKRPVTPERVTIVERKDAEKPQQKTQHGWMKQDTGGVPDLDKSKKANLATAAIAATAFAAYNKKVSSPPRQETPPPQMTPQRAKYNEADGDGGRKRSVVTPRTILLAPRDEDDQYPVSNRDFDGRALDPNTGRVYEYNTRTNERRWLETPPSY